jgi:hypothetical protein
LIQGRRVAAGCRGAQAKFYEAVLTCAVHGVLVTDAVGAVAATALTVVVAGAAKPFARARAINAVAATALSVLLTLLPVALTARRGGSSLTDTK